MTQAARSTDEALRKRLSASILRIRTANPFFGVLALFADIEVSHQVDNAATNGKDIYINPHFCEKLSSNAITGLLLHEILHCALEHVTRRGPREPQTWNVAADIVVNGMIREAGYFELPADAVEDEELAGLSTEDIYARLLESSKTHHCPMPDLDTDSQRATGAMAEQERQKIARHWRIARSQAVSIARKYGQDFGESSGNEWRELKLLDEPQLDWRTLLWQFLARTPSDFSGFDRRFVGRGLYLDALEAESLELRIAIDTSASIDSKALSEFLTEVDAILATYPQASAELYFADTALYGPYELTPDVQMPQPKGGGGTSFRPFFSHLSKQSTRSDGDLIVLYFTDGYGDFPVNEPGAEVLWLVTDDGLDDASFPFGTVIRFDPKS